MKMLISSLVSLLLVKSTIADKPTQNNNAWNLKFSDPNRGGKFLNIPIHYGDWVPITAAKALVEEVASRHQGRLPLPVPEAAEKVQHVEESKESVVEAVAPESDRRSDHGDVVYVNSRNRGYQTSFRHQAVHHQQPHHHGHRPVHHNPNNRRQDASKGIRFSHNNINVDASRRNTKKLPPPPPTHFNQIGQNVVRNKPVPIPKPVPVPKPVPIQKPVPVPQQQSAFSFVPSFNSFSAFNPFSFFGNSDASGTPPPRGVAIPVSNDKSSTNVNAIKTIAAPDLSKYGPGPPVIELDSGADGEIILGRPFNVGGDHDHLAGFVSLDFDGFTPGDRDSDKAKAKKSQEKEKLSIIVGGKTNAKPRDQSDLVNFLNNDKENAETFVFSSDKSPPKGFAKIDLPFMDPTKHDGDLPKAFIAPKGIPIPEGYKGKPLPHQTQPSVATTEKVLLHQTNRDLFRPRPSIVSRDQDLVTKSAQTTTTTDKPSTTSNKLFSRYKARPSLSDFIRKNKKKVALLDDRVDSSRERVRENSAEKIYVNNRIEEARKELFGSYKPTESTDDVIIPVENNFNTFKLVTDNHEHTSTEHVKIHDIVVESDNNIIDVISAGDDDNDPISLVFDPEPALTQSTLEQAEDDDEEVVETTSVETSTSFAPTVIPTVATETTTASPTTLRTTTVVETSSTTTTSTSTTTTSTVTTTTTSTTTTSTTTTTTFESTERFVKYTTQDPFARLDSLRKKLKYGHGKTTSTSTVSVPSYQGDLLTAEDIDETDSQSTEAPAFNFASPFRRFQRPKYGNEKDFGKRIRKKKPGKWVKKYTSDKLGLFGGSVEPTRRPYRSRSRLSSYTSTSTTESTTTENDNKYGPYRATFEQIYKDAFHVDNVDTDTNRNSRFSLPRRRNHIPRSTSPAPPFTVDAEVYEVHPKTRLRLTTRSPTTKVHHPLVHTTTQVKTAEAEETDYYTYQDDYVYEPTTQSETLKIEEEERVTTTTPPLEYQEYVPTVKVYTEVTEEASTTTTAAVVTEEDVHEDVHETADKHSTTTLPTVETTYVYEHENDVDVDRVDLDIENEISDQLVEESQQIETTWNGVVKAEDHTQANTRLSTYEKNVDTSKYGDDKEYNVTGLEAQVNEHSKPVTGVQDDKTESWQPSASPVPVRSYYEINRSQQPAAAGPIVTIEEVEITDPKDYSETDIIYDVTKDSFDADTDTFSVPVAVSFNIPTTTVADTTTTASLGQDSTTTTVVAETETTSLVNNVPETTTLQETTTTSTTTAPTTTTEVEEETTTTTAAPTVVTEEVTVTTTLPTTERQATTHSRLYSLIQRNRNKLRTTTVRSLPGEVFLGSRPTSTIRPSTAAPTTVVIDISKSAHKVPNSIWSTFERSRGEASTTTDKPFVIEEHSVDELSESNTNSNVVVDLPKPSQHESEVLVEIKEDSQGGFVPRRPSKISTKGKEKWIKDLVSRKKYTSSKYRGPFSPSLQKSQYRPETTSQAVTTTTTTKAQEVKENKNEVALDDAANELLLSLFAPTMPPKTAPEDKNERHRLVSDKFSSRPRQSVLSSIFHKSESSSTPAEEVRSEPVVSKPVRYGGVPRGARTEVFKSYGGASLSQADFERNILGVSTATEISVKSMICVKGRCFNADETGKLLNN